MRNRTIEEQVNTGMSGRSYRQALVWLAASALATLPACGQKEEKEATSVELAFVYDPGEYEIDQFEIHGLTGGGAPAFEPAVVPEEDGSLLDSGRETLVVLLGDDLAGTEITFSATALRRGAPVAAAQGIITPIVDEMVKLELHMHPVVVPGCGNSTIDVTTGEECDDGNTDPGDGCSPSCRTEAGFECTGEPSICEALCGDGLVRGAEECDDANTEPGDGCGTYCLIEAGWACTGEPSTCTSDCGDGEVRGAEECDDGNLDDGDGCSAICREEDGWSCSGQPSECVTECGDGFPRGPEECDDGNIEPNDGCSEVCILENGWECSGEPSGCAPVCGDGLIIGGEGCDDGNTDPDDGCSATCEQEDGWSCSGQPSECVTECGDGFPRGAEECDDGNTDPDDGCTPDCTVEPDYECSQEPSVCEPMACTQDSDCQYFCSLTAGHCAVESSIAFVDCDNGPWNGDGSPSSPYDSIQPAVDASANVYVMTSTCDATVMIDAHDVELVGAAGATLAAPTHAIQVEQVTAVIRKMTITGVSEHSGGGVWVTNGGSASLIENSITDANLLGVICDTGNLSQGHCVLRRNYIRNNLSGGVRITGYSYEIVNNIIVDNGTLDYGIISPGVILSETGAPRVFMNNTVAFNSNQHTGFDGDAAGIQCYPETDNLEIVNSIVWENGPNPQVSGCSTSYSDIGPGATGLSPTDIQQDPVFWWPANGDYFITPDSPCIDHGTSTGAPSVDFEGDMRPQGSGIDIGADERG